MTCSVAVLIFCAYVCVQASTLTGTLTIVVPVNELHALTDANRKQRMTIAPIVLNNHASGM